MRRDADNCDVLLVLCITLVTIGGIALWVAVVYQNSCGQGVI